jgi:hypothetical protein
VETPDRTEKAAVNDELVKAVAIGKTTAYVERAF